MHVRWGDDHDGGEVVDMYDRCTIWMETVGAKCVI